MLSLAGGNKKRAANLLGISRSTHYWLMASSLSAASASRSYTLGGLCR